MSQPVTVRPFTAGGPPYPPPAAKATTTGPKVMTAVGIVLTVLAIGLVVAGVARVADTVSDDVLELRNGSGALVAVREDIPGPVTVDAEADGTYAILFLGDNEEAIHPDDLSVTGPDGRYLDLSPSSVTYSFSSSHSVTSKVATFEADEPGEYVLTVDGASASAYGELAILDDELVSHLVVGTLTGTLLIIAGVIGGILGVGLLVGGGVWWSARRSGRRPVNL